MADQSDAGRLADASEALIATVENGPWAAIPDPGLRQFVGEHVAEACHTAAAAAGLDEAMERAHDLMPTRLGMSLPGAGIAPDARDRLARHLLAAAVGPNWRAEMVSGWDRGTLDAEQRAEFLAQADEILAVIAGTSDQ